MKAQPARPAVDDGGAVLEAKERQATINASLTVPASMARRIRSALALEGRTFVDVFAGALAPYMEDDAAPMGRR